MKQLLSKLKTIGTLSLYRKNSSLYFQGEVPRHVTIVLDGIVKAYTISLDGDETIVNLYGKGKIIPMEWVNDQATTALFNYEAVNDVRVLRVNKTDFWAALEDPALQREYLMIVAQSQTGLLLRVTGLCQARATEKICYTLYYLMFHYGLERPNGLYELDLKLTQTMIASLIGQTRESTAKNLKLLRNAGIINYSSSTYFIHKQKLENYLGEDSFRGMELS